MRPQIAQLSVFAAAYWALILPDTSLVSLDLSHRVMTEADVYNYKGFALHKLSASVLNFHAPAIEDRQSIDRRQPKQPLTKGYFDVQHATLAEGLIMIEFARAVKPWIEMYQWTMNHVLERIFEQLARWRSTAQKTSWIRDSPDQLWWQRIFKECNTVSFVFVFINFCNQFRKMAILPEMAYLRNAMLQRDELMHSFLCQLWIGSKTYRTAEKNYNHGAKKKPNTYEEEMKIDSPKSARKIMKARQKVMRVAQLTRAGTVYVMFKRFLLATTPPSLNQLKATMCTPLDFLGPQKGYVLLFLNAMTETIMVNQRCYDLMMGRVAQYLSQAYPGELTPYRPVDAKNHAKNEILTMPDFVEELPAYLVDIAGKSYHRMVVFHTTSVTQGSRKTALEPIAMSAVECLGESSQLWNRIMEHLWAFKADCVPGTPSNAPYNLAKTDVNVHDQLLPEMHTAVLNALDQYPHLANVYYSLRTLMNIGTVFESPFLAAFVSYDHSVTERYMPAYKVMVTINQAHLTFYYIGVNLQRLSAVIMHNLVDHKKVTSKLRSEELPFDHGLQDVDFTWHRTLLDVITTPIVSSATHNVEYIRPPPRGAYMEVPDVFWDDFTTEVLAMTNLEAVGLREAQPGVNVEVKGEDITYVSASKSNKWRELRVINPEAIAFVLDGRLWDSPLRYLVVTLAILTGNPELAVKARNILLAELENALICWEIEYYINFYEVIVRIVPLAVQSLTAWFWANPNLHRLWCQIGGGPIQYGPTRANLWAGSKLYALLTNGHTNVLVNFAKCANVLGYAMQEAGSYVLAKKFEMYRQKQTTGAVTHIEPPLGWFMGSNENIVLRKGDVVSRLPDQHDTGFLKDAARLHQQTAYNEKTREEKADMSKRVGKFYSELQMGTRNAIPRYQARPWVSELKKYEEVGIRPPTALSPSGYLQEGARDIRPGQYSMMISGKRCKQSEMMALTVSQENENESDIVAYRLNDALTIAVNRAVNIGAIVPGVGNPQGVAANVSGVVSVPDEDQTGLSTSGSLSAHFEDHSEMNQPVGTEFTFATETPMVSQQQSREPSMVRATRKSPQRARSEPSSSEGEDFPAQNPERSTQKGDAPEEEIDDVAETSAVSVPSPVWNPYFSASKGKSLARMPVWTDAVITSEVTTTVQAPSPSITPSTVGGLTPSPGLGTPLQIMSQVPLPPGVDQQTMARAMQVAYQSVTEYFAQSALVQPAATQGIGMSPIISNVPAFPMTPAAFTTSTPNQPPPVTGLQLQGNFPSLQPSGTATGGLGAFQFTPVTAASAIFPMTTGFNRPPAPQFMSGVSPMVAASVSVPVTASVSPSDRGDSRRRNRQRSRSPNSPSRSSRSHKSSSKKQRRY